MRSYNLKHGDECEIISQDGDRSRVRFDDGYETETPTAELLDADEHERMVCGLVRQAISNGRRLNHLADVCRGEIVVEPIVRDAIQEREFEREYAR